MSPQPVSEAGAGRITPWRLARWGLQGLAVTVMLWWALTQADWGEMGRALARIPLASFATGVALSMVGMCLAGWRWRMLLYGFGATRLPPVLTLIRLFFVGLFYNTFVPGSVGGDVVRGVVSRACFDGGVASYVVVGVERLIGLSALAVVAAVGLLVSPPWVALEGGSLWLVGGAIGAGVLVVGALALLSGRLGQRIRRIWISVPRVHHPRALAGAWLISLVGHGLTLGAYALIADGLQLPLDLATLAWVVPLALLASVIPLAIAGVGPREAAVVGLLALLSIPREEALVFSLSFAMILWILAGLGGLLALLVGVDLPDQAES